MQKLSGHDGAMPQIRHLVLALRATKSFPETPLHEALRSPRHMLESSPLEPAQQRDRSYGSYGLSAELDDLLAGALGGGEGEGVSVRSPWRARAQLLKSRHL